jgi:hypothetical protein
MVAEMAATQKIDTPAGSTATDDMANYAATQVAARLGTEQEAAQKAVTPAGSTGTDNMADYAATHAMPAPTGNTIPQTHAAPAPTESGATPAGSAATENMAGYAATRAMPLPAHLAATQKAAHSSGCPAGSTSTHNMADFAATQVMQQAPAQSGEWPACSVGTEDLADYAATQMVTRPAATPIAAAKIAAAAPAPEPMQTTPQPGKTPATGCADDAAMTTTPTAAPGKDITMAAMDITPGSMQTGTPMAAITAVTRPAPPTPPADSPEPTTGNMSASASPALQGAAKVSSIAGIGNVISNQGTAVPAAQPVMSAALPPRPPLGIFKAPSAAQTAMLKMPTNNQLLNNIINKPLAVPAAAKPVTAAAGPPAGLALPKPLVITHATGSSAAPSLTLPKIGSSTPFTFQPPISQNKPSTLALPTSGEAEGHQGYNHSPPGCL